MTIDSLFDTILTLIFDFASSNTTSSNTCDPSTDPARSFCSSNQGILDLCPRGCGDHLGFATKRSISLVCKRWHCAVAPVLYKILVVKDGQFHRLLQTLEQSDKSAVSAGSSLSISDPPSRGFGRHARRLIVVPPPFPWAQHCDYQLPPWSNDYKAVDNYTTNWRELISHIGPTLVTLHSTSPTLSSKTLTVILEGSPRLRTIAVRFPSYCKDLDNNDPWGPLVRPHPSIILRPTNSDNPITSFPFLRFLEITVSVEWPDSVGVLLPDLITAIPSLQTVYLLWIHPQSKVKGALKLAQHCPSLSHFLRVQGPHLTTIYLENFGRRLNDTVKEVEESCPHLEELVFEVLGWSDIPPDMRLPHRLKRLGIKCREESLASPYKLWKLLTHAGGEGLEVVTFFRPRDRRRIRSALAGELEVMKRMAGERWPLKIQFVDAQVVGETGTDIYYLKTDTANRG